MNSTYTIRQILTGYQFLDKGLYGTFRKGSGTIIKHPVFAFLIEGNGKKYLVDTGMSSTEHSVLYHHDGLQEAGQAIHLQLLRIGIKPDEIDAIIFTHLHWDHCANMKEFKNAKYYVSEVEYNFAKNPIPPYWSSYEHPAVNLKAEFEGCEFNFITAETEFVDGITVFPSPGHSPGHIAVSVRSTKGIYCIAGDLMYLRENLEPDKENGWPMTPPGRFCNLVEVWHSMEEVIKRSDYILMSHDPSQIGVEIFPNEDDYRFKNFRKGQK